MANAGTTPCTADVDPPEGRAGAAAWMTAFMGEEAGAPGERFADSANSPPR